MAQLSARPSHICADGPECRLLQLAARESQSQTDVPTVQHDRAPKVAQPAKLTSNSNSHGQSLATSHRQPDVAQRCQPKRVAVSPYSCLKRRASIAVRRRGQLDGPASHSDVGAGAAVPMPHRQMPKPRAL
eukprot:scaffold49256_cov489-Isochrysis_galbana.AAC.1